jgi:hypothetical protein
LLARALRAGGNANGADAFGPRGTRGLGLDELGQHVDAHGARGAFHQAGGQELIREDGIVADFLVALTFRFGGGRGRRGRRLLVLERHFNGFLLRCSLLRVTRAEAEDDPGVQDAGCYCC